MLQGCSVEDVVRSGDGGTARLQVANVTDEEFDLMGDIGILGLVFMTHVVLLLFVAGEDADFADICSEETLENSVPETSSAS